MKDDDDQFVFRGRSNRRFLSSTLNYKPLFPPIPKQEVYLAAPYYLTHDMSNKEVFEKMCAIYKGCFFLYTKKKASQYMKFEYDKQILSLAKSLIQEEIAPEVFILEQFRYAKKNAEKYASLNKKTFGLPPFSYMMGTQMFTKYPSLVNDLKQHTVLKTVVQNPYTIELSQFMTRVESKIRLLELSTVDEIKKAVKEHFDYKAFDELIQKFSDVEARRKKVCEIAQQYHIPLWADPTFIEYLEERIPNLNG